MSIADQTDLLVTARLLRAGLYQPSAPYPTETLKRAVAGVAKRLTYAPLRRSW
jgi:hypothetical protein|nr:hypothetical protein NG677_19730 [Methylobacterium sp. OTU13CASTA1]